MEPEKSYRWRTERKKEDWVHERNIGRVIEVLNIFQAYLQYLISNFTIIT
jgi:hypothetical protein